MTTFSATSTNSGAIVNKNFYVKTDDDKTDIGKSVLDSVTKSISGIALTDLVDMMVTGKMGYTVEHKQAEITNANVRMSALSQLSSTVSELISSTLEPLNDINALSSYSISSSNTSAASVSVSDSGIDNVVGINLDINNTAQSQTLMVNGFTDASNNLSSGIFSIQFGKYDGGGNQEINSNISEVSISITDGMSLKELAAAINSQTNDVEATVITNSDGSLSLAIMGTNIGANSAMKISTSGGGNNDLINYSGANTVNVSSTQDAVDASYSINGAPFTSSSNTVTHFGIDLTLQSATTNTVSISTEVDSSNVVSNISSFIKNYNQLMTVYNAMNESSSGEEFQGSLHGTDIAENIESTMEGMWATIKDKGLALSLIGIKKDDDGYLTLTTSELTSALEESPNIVYSLLGSTNTISNSEAYAISSIGDSKDGQYTLVVDNAPKKAVMTSTALSGTTTFSSDTIIDFELSGKNVAVTIPAGDYSGSEVATIINNAFKNSNASDFSASINASNELTLSSNGYGTREWVTVKTDVPELGFTSGTKISGEDVKGYLNGERFIGAGTKITSNKSPLDGLAITVTPSKLVLNENVAISISSGVLDIMKNSFDNLVDDSSGIITSEIKEIEKSLSESADDSLISELDKLEEDHDMWYTYYSKLYSKLASDLNELQSQQDFLDSMFGSDDKKK